VQLIGGGIRHFLSGRVGFTGKHADGLHEIPPGSFGIPGNFSLNPRRDPNGYAHEWRGLVSQRRSRQNMPLSNRVVGPGTDAGVG
jgi:hypothetical protein